MALYFYQALTKGGKKARIVSTNRDCDDYPILAIIVNEKLKYLDDWNDKI